MGCGSSSLKGEKSADIGGGDLGPPAKKVRTNFSDVDFSTGRTDGRRGTTAVAPDEEHQRPSRISEAGVENIPDMPRTSGHTRAELAGEKLEPYKSIETGPNMTESGVPQPGNVEATPLTTGGTVH